MVIFRELKNYSRENLLTMLEQSVTKARVYYSTLIARPIQEGKVDNYQGAFPLVSCPEEDEEAL